MVDFRSGNPAYSVSRPRLLKFPPSSAMPVQDPARRAAAGRHGYRSSLAALPVDGGANTSKRRGREVAHVLARRPITWCPCPTGGHHRQAAREHRSPGSQAIFSTFLLRPTVTLGRPGLQLHHCPGRPTVITGTSPCRGRSLGQAARRLHRRRWCQASCRPRDWQEPRLRHRR